MPYKYLGNIQLSCLVISSDKYLIYRPNIIIIIIIAIII